MNKRKIGQGMKPRGEMTHPHPATHRDHEQPHSDCEECQTFSESIIQPILDRQTDSVQNLDSAETTEKTILDEVIDAEFVDPEIDSAANAGESSDLDEGFKELNQANKVLPLRPEGGLIDGIHSDYGYGVQTMTDAATGQRRARIWALGEQSNGSVKIVTTIPEGYYNAVKDWAESAGLTVEEWIDQCLSQYLETWGQPAQSR